MSPNGKNRSPLFSGSVAFVFSLLVTGTPLWAFEVVTGDLSCATCHEDFYGGSPWHLWHEFSFGLRCGLCHSDGFEGPVLTRDCADCHLPGEEDIICAWTLEHDALPGAAVTCSICHYECGGEGDPDEAPDAGSVGKGSCGCSSFGGEPPSRAQFGATGLLTLVPLLFLFGVRRRLNGRERSGSRTRWIVLPLVLICGIGLGSTPARTASITGHALTWMGVFDETLAGEKGTFIPVYEHLSLSLTDFEMEGFSFHLAGYARHHLASNFDGDVTRVEMTYGYLDYRGWENRLTLRAGRQLIFMGVASEYADALTVRLDGPGDFGGSLFAGLPVLSAFGSKEGDSLYGGRFHYELFEIAEVGASLLYAKENNAPDRFNIGLDAWVEPTDWLDLTGHLFLDLIYQQLYDIALLGRVRPMEGLNLSVRFNDTVPSSFISKRSVLSVFSNEEIREIGASLDYPIGPSLSLEADYSFFDYETGDDAHQYGGRVTYRRPGSAGLVGIGANRTDAESNGYTGVRLFARRGLGSLPLTWNVEVYTFFYDEKIGGEDVSVNGALDLAYKVRDRLEVVGALEYSNNPIFDEEVRGILKVSYGYLGRIGR